MKYAIVIIDGAADRPLDVLDGKTPLEAADKPVMDAIAATGRMGTTCNVPESLSPGSDVAILSLLGYDPLEGYTGRAPLEAAAQGLTIGADEWVFRCNTVTIIDGIMEDYSAGHISTEEASALIRELGEVLGDASAGFHPGVSYRHLLTVDFDCRKVKTTPPHDILSQPVKKHLPSGRNAERLTALMDRARAILAEHEINRVRRDLGENPATDIWLWGGGQMPSLEPFKRKYGLNVAVITAVDLVAGIATLTGMTRIEVPGCTGYVDTNYTGKGRAAAEALDNFDMVVVHVEAPDECGHNAQAELKAQSLTDIDRLIVAPLVERLKREGEDWRFLVMPDHPTPCELRTHTREPVPFAMAGKDLRSVVAPKRYTEANAAESDLHIPVGCELMEFFIKPSRE